MLVLNEQLNLLASCGCTKVRELGALGLASACWEVLMWISEGGALWGCV